MGIGLISLRGTAWLMLGLPARSQVICDWLGLESYLYESRFNTDFTHTRFNPYLLRHIASVMIAKYD